MTSGNDDDVRRSLVLNALILVDDVLPSCDVRFVADA
jgi:hypothetical protein